jgi:oligopeptide transport system permease protein
MANQQAVTYDLSDSAQNEKIDSSEFEWVGSDTKAMETISRPSISFWKDALSRLKKSKVAMVCIIFLVALILGAVFIPIFCPFNYAQQNVAYSNQPPMWVDNITHNAHIFGTDTLGRDIWVRVWMGARVSLTVAFAVTLIDCLVGCIYGGISGYFGGGIDNVMMRILEIVGGIPYLIIVMLLLVVLPRGLMTIIIAYSITGWTGMARLVRGQVLGIRKQEFMIAAESMGAKPSWVIARHIIPNLVSIIVVNVTLDIPNVIFTEAFLSMLGLGISPPQSSWGILAYDGISVFQVYPTQLLFPALFISLTMLAFNLLGDQMRDAFDPKLRR